FGRRAHDDLLVYDRPMGSNRRRRDGSLKTSSSQSAIEPVTYVTGVQNVHPSLSRGKDRNETSPPTISPSGRGRCRAISIITNGKTPDLRVASDHDNRAIKGPTAQKTT